MKKSTSLILLPLLFCLTGCIRFLNEEHDTGLSENAFIDIEARLFNGDSMPASTDAHTTMIFNYQTTNSYTALDASDLNSYVSVDNSVTLSSVEAGNIYKSMGYKDSGNNEIGGLALGDATLTRGVDATNTNMLAEEVNNYVTFSFTGTTFTKVVISAIPRFDKKFTGEAKDQFTHNTSVALSVDIGTEANNTKSNKFIKLSEENFTEETIAQNIKKCCFSLGDTAKSSFTLRAYGQQALITQIELY